MIRGDLLERGECEPSPKWQAEPAMCTSGGKSIPGRRTRKYKALGGNTLDYVLETERRPVWLE